MIITFLGHSKVCEKDKLYDRLVNILSKNTVGADKIIFYCGGYGDFDGLSLKACKAVQNKKSNCEIVFVTPYITDSYQKKMEFLLKSGLYNSTVYPPLENVPYKFAISKRNEWMVCEADLIIAYIDHSYGGAYKALEYAHKKKKKIINLGELNLE